MTDEEINKQLEHVSDGEATAHIIICTKKVFQDDEQRYRYYKLIIPAIKHNDRYNICLGFDPQYRRAFNDLYPNQVSN